MGTALGEFSDSLKAKTNSDVYYIKGVMKTTAGNDYQGLTLDGITITVYATQLTAEFDSFDKTYDANGNGNAVIYSYGGTITVKGGTFVNYDPSKGDDNLHGNFVADGYKVVTETHGSDTWYTVVAK